MQRLRKFAVLPSGHVMIQLSLGSALQVVTASTVVLTLEENFRPVNCDEACAKQADIFLVVTISSMCDLDDEVRSPFSAIRVQFCLKYVIQMQMTCVCL